MNPKRPHPDPHGFAFAIRGMLYALRTERNLRLQTVIAAYVLYFASYYNPSRSEYAILLLAIGLVIALELANTAIEHAVDLRCPDRHEDAKRAKDAAAAAVLIAAIVSVAVGVLFFYDPPVLAHIAGVFLSHPMRLVILAITLALAWFYVYVGPATPPGDHTDP